MTKTFQIGIAGLGFVGNAVYQALKKRHLSLVVYDKYKTSPEALKDQGPKAQESSSPEPINKLLKTDMVFLCLPTPYLNERQEYDLVALTEVCKFLADHEYPGLVIIKSTVLPGTSQSLATEYNLKIIHNPEFLSARTAVEDFENQKQVVLGLTDQCASSDRKTVELFYQIFFAEAQISLTTSGHSEAMKVFCNSFYAVKVQIFNEFYALSQKLDLDYPTILQMMLRNGWINPMHTQVPGPDGKLSYGGACFVKDTQALLAQMTQEDTPHQLLTACVDEQKQMRPE